MTDYECFDSERCLIERKKIQEMISEEKLEQQVNCFKVLGDLNRIKIMHVLMHYDQLCVNDISMLIDATVATTSHHLIVLKNSGIIRCQKQGKRVIYSLSNQVICNLIGIAKQLKAKCEKCGQIHD